ncbi:MAG: hypothetical protein CMJ33_08535 [Phycisphaerae bacterium]|nr:hypothetical protein [Phycisphaerae bacterium]HAW96613.1 hypothetical protein [Phycisphaerales bacterium]
MTRTRNESSGADDHPIELTPRSKTRAMLGSAGLFGGIGVIWVLITMIAPDFYASSGSPIAYLVTVGAVLLLFGGLVTGQVSSIRAWFGSLSEVDGIDKRRLRWFAVIVFVCVGVGMLAAISIFLFNQFVWLPEVREIIE